jgi:hypothetical protein
VEHVPAPVPSAAVAPEISVPELHRVEASVPAHPELAPSLPANAPEIPRVALELPAESGLVLVETTHAEPLEVEEVEPARPRRVRPPRVAVADEPLQMIETTQRDPNPPAAE